MKTGIELIAQERKEQLEKHGIAIMEDVQNNDYGQLRVAAAWMIPSDDDNYNECNPHLEDSLMEACPDDWNENLWRHMIKKPTKDRLIIAGALIAAELDRMIALEEMQNLNGMDDRLDQYGF